ncbi:hypothetical protein N7468_003505 [Penicillium chermesinum]|uniref:Uncharacterized protein n=1 Tax=Penicillium chermesinum TaxID=63820 RepID=A0A9W9P7A0_9EURO|nr:uncharacterized protein N7468_003505 [Penicillium chermesinum]KAJ5238886.1 hypothetical protein N7468_003505 [Penicillium chermesinum]
MMRIATDIVTAIERTEKFICCSMTDAMWMMTSGAVECPGVCFTAYSRCHIPLGLQPTNRSGTIEMTHVFLKPMSALVYRLLVVAKPVRYYFY